MSALSISSISSTTRAGAASASPSGPSLMYFAMSRDVAAEPRVVQALHGVVDVEAVLGLGRRLDVPADQRQLERRARGSRRAASCRCRARRARAAAARARPRRSPRGAAPPRRCTCRCRETDRTARHWTSATSATIWTMYYFFRPWMYASADRVEVGRQVGQAEHAADQRQAEQEPRAGHDRDHEHADRLVGLAVHQLTDTRDDRAAHRRHDAATTRTLDQRIAHAGTMTSEPVGGTEHEQDVVRLERAFIDWVFELRLAARGSG